MSSNFFSLSPLFNFILFMYIYQYKLFSLKTSNKPYIDKYTHTLSLSQKKKIIIITAAPPLHLFTHL